MSRHSGYEYSDCRIMIIKAVNDSNMQGGIGYIKGATGFKERDTYLEFENLDSGTYYAYIEVEWNETTTYEEQYFNVTTYGQGKTIFKGDEDVG